MIKIEKTVKIKVKTTITAYYKDEANKTIQEEVLKLIEKDMESKAKRLSI